MKDERCFCAALRAVFSLLTVHEIKRKITDRRNSQRNEKQTNLWLSLCAEYKLVDYIALTFSILWAVRNADT